MRSLHRRPHRAIGSIGVVTLAALAIALVGSPAIALAASTDGSISGVVSDSITTNPVAAICVRAAGGSGSAATHSNAEGEYTLADLSPGTYTVKFSGCRTTLGYVTQYYDDQATSAEANPVTVDAGGNTAGIDASMVLGGGISGSVTDESTPPDPLSDICVAATASGSTAVSTTTNASGDYSYAGLTPGSYEVKFTDCHHHVYVPTSYASAVTVTAGVTTTGIDVAMSLPGSISGTVTDSDTSNPLAGICVSAEDWNTGKVLSTDISGSDGTYSLPGLVGGTYGVQFSGCGATSDYVGQFWDDEVSFYYSDPVTVSDGTDTGAIDASMVQGGSISGTVTDYSTPPVPLSDICVAADVIEQGGGPDRGSARSTDAAATTTTNAEGDYSFAALSADEYELEFTDCHNHKYLAEDYEYVYVTPGSSATGIDVAMPLPGSISGTVTSNSTETICVSTYENSSTAKLAPGGSYTLTGLYPGSDTVAFGSCKRSKYVYVTQTLDNVIVSSGANTPDVDANLTLGGDISGKVKNYNDYATIVIEATSTTGVPVGEVDINTNLDPTGKYSISGLLGSCDVYFFYGVNTTEKVTYKKNPVEVASGVTHGGINARIPSGY